MPALVISRRVLVVQPIRSHAASAVMMQVLAKAAWIRASVVGPIVGMRSAAAMVR